MTGPVILSAEARERVELLKTLLERYDDPSRLDDQLFRILLVVNGILDSADADDANVRGKSLGKETQRGTA